MRIVDYCIFGSLLFFASVASAQNIFVDGFEDGNACGWSAVVEAEETEVTAEPLLDSTDCDDDIRSFTGTLYGADDVDFFQVRVYDEFGCTIDPRIMFSGQPDVSICIFVECLQGYDAVVDCLGASTSTTSPTGHPGCCALSEPFDFDYFCDGPVVTIHDANVWIRVETSAVGCATYSGDVHF